MALSESQKKFLREAATAATQTELSTGIPAELTLAQAILESGWGKVKPGWNIFGIKSHPSTKEFGRQLLLTREWFNPKELAWFLSLGDGRSATLVYPTLPPNAKGRQQYRVYDWFATFPDITACFIARARLFRYGVYAVHQAAYQADSNFEAYVRGISKTYASAPNYADVILSIARGSEVAEALDEAREELEKRLV